LKALRTAALFALLTAVLTWPLVLRLRVMDPGDSAYFAWAVGWGLHALWTDPLSLPHGNVLHPARYTLFMDEPVLGTTVLVLPFRFLTDDAVLLFNLARLLTFWASGFTMYLLARDRRLPEAAALFAGAMFAFSPIRTDQIAHLSTLGTQWWPLVLLFLFRFADQGRLRDGVLSGAFFALAAWACGYHGLFGLVLLPLAALPLVWGRPRLLLLGLPGLAAAGALLLPLQRLHGRAFAEHGFSRPLDHAVAHAASLETFLSTSSWNVLWGRATDTFRAEGANNLFPGLTLLAVVAWWALARARAGRRPDRTAVAVVVLVTAAALLALGPEVRAFGRTLLPGPYALVRAALPVFESVRVTSRAGIFVALGLALLGGRALAGLRPGRPATALLAGAALAETLIVPIPLPDWARVIDTSRPLPPVYAWLAARSAGSVVAELPMMETHVFTRPAFDESVYMVWSTRHWQRLVNGAAGVEPASYRRVREASRRFPSAESLAALRAVGARYVVVHLAGLGPNQRARYDRDLPAFRGCCLRAAAEFPGVTVFELTPSPASPGP
jgi:hypothetical protein